MTSSRISLAGGLLLLFVLFGSLQDASAIPAFARKYGLRCSACHVAWPVLNDFGWRFKDNGYQLMNDRDADLAESCLLAYHVAHYSELASREHQQGGRGHWAARSGYW